jgi:ferredoxin
VIIGDRVVLTRERLGDLLTALRTDGYRLVGPTVRDGAIVHAEIDGIDDLPAGWTTAQEAGAYRLRPRENRALFGYAVGPHSWKPYFFVPTRRLWRARRRDETFEVVEERSEAPRLALIGARACDLHAVAIQDRIFGGGQHIDADYAARRQDVFVVAVNCGEAGGTCFCTSMNAGPRVTQGFDLALTELIDAEGHRFLGEIGSVAGAALLSGLSHDLARDEDRRAADQVVERTAQSMGRALEVGGIKELLYRNLGHPRWDDVAGRCLGCANCTLVCPTCFCATVEDTTDLTGEHAERIRRWDSCFTLGHSHVHGGSVRASLKARYRQWLTHKLASWIDQFGSSGCVGCGRCITWCPVGIDITQEVAAIRATDGAGPAASHGETDGDA